MFFVIFAVLVVVGFFGYIAFDENDGEAIVYGIMGGLIAGLLAAITVSVINEATADTIVLTDGYTISFENDDVCIDADEVSFCVERVDVVNGDDRVEVVEPAGVSWTNLGVSGDIVIYTNDADIDGVES